MNIDDFIFTKTSFHLFTRLIYLRAGGIMHHEKRVDVVRTALGLGWLSQCDQNLACAYDRIVTHFTPAMSEAHYDAGVCLPRYLGNGWRLYA